MSRESRTYSGLKQKSWLALCALLLLFGWLLFQEQDASAASSCGAIDLPEVIQQTGPLLGFTPTPTPTPTSTPTVHPTPTPITPVKAEPVIVKRGEPSEAYPGEEVRFIIEVTNEGQHAAVDVVVTDEVSEYLEILEVTTTQGSTAINGQVVTVDVGVVGPGFVVEIVIRTRLRLDVPAPLTLTNVAVLDSPNGGGSTSTPMTITVPEPLLPVTGQGAFLWPWSALLGVSLLSCGLWLGIRREAQHNRLG